MVESRRYIVKCRVCGRQFAVRTSNGDIYANCPECGNIEARDVSGRGYLAKCRKEMSNACSGRKAIFQNNERRAKKGNEKRN